MLKSFPKILTILFLTIFIFQLACLLFLTLIPNAGRAADPATFKPQVEIPDMKEEFGAVDKTDGYAIPGSTASIAKYVRVVYKYAIGIVGILAAVVLMIGGVMWIIAGGSATMIGEAKAWIGASLTGLVLALLSYVILATVNPALVDFKTTGIKTVEKIEPTISETCQATKATDWNHPCSSLSGNGWTLKDASKCENYNSLADNVCCCKENELTPPIIDVTKKHMGCELESPLSGRLQLVCKEIAGEGSNQCNSTQDCIDNQSVCCLQNYNLWGFCPICFTGYGKCNIMTNKACKAISGTAAYPNSTCQNQAYTFGYNKECKIN